METWEIPDAISLSIMTLRKRVTSVRDICALDEDLADKAPSTPISTRMKECYKISAYVMTSQVINDHPKRYILIIST